MMLDGAQGGFSLCFAVCVQQPAWPVGNPYDLSAAIDIHLIFITPIVLCLPNALLSHSLSVPSIIPPQSFLPSLTQPLSPSSLSSSSLLIVLFICLPFLLPSPFLSPLILSMCTFSSLLSLFFCLSIHIFSSPLIILSSPLSLSLLCWSAKSHLLHPLTQNHFPNKISRYS